MSEETSVSSWGEANVNSNDDITLLEIPENVRVYEITGPLFFGAADKILDIEFEERTRCLILRMRSVNAIDSTAMSSLEMILKRCSDKQVRLILSHVNPQPMKAMKKSGFYDRLGSENFFANITAALSGAKTYSHKSEQNV